MMRGLLARSAALGGMLALGACAAQPQRVETVPASATAPAQAATRAPPHAMQWLYGSAESTLAARQVYAQITAFGLAAAKARPAQSVVLEAGATPDAPRFEPCGSKPLAAIFDADETLVWNVGAQRVLGQRGMDFDRGIWSQWELDDKGQTRAMPGAVEMVSALRAAGIAVYVISNRSAASNQATAQVLKRLGFGDFVPGDTLLLMPNDGPSTKDPRRAQVTATHCVVLMGGDQLGDFSQAFNAGVPPAQRAAMTQAPGVAPLWGRGWFLLSNPVYGPWDTYDDAATFPGVTWSPTQGAE